LIKSTFALNDFGVKPVPADRIARSHPIATMLLQHLFVIKYRFLLFFVRIGDTMRFLVSALHIKSELSKQELVSLVILT
jgi:hypothetical protein